MESFPLGDSAVLLRDLTLPAYGVADALNKRKVQGVVEAVASYDTVAVYFDPEAFDLDSLEEYVANMGEDVEFRQPASHKLPICYELGGDLEHVAITLNLDPEEVISHHLSTSYRCYAVGFCPGFPYLGYLPRALWAVTRLNTPRVRTKPGSVGITGRQTAIYTVDMPGGWPIIGATPLSLVDVGSRYFPIHAGDEVTFERIDKAEFSKLKGKRL